MPYKERAIEKRYFSIGEVAEQLKVAPSLIRFWESEFDIIRPRKNRKGTRQFTQEDIKNLTLIYHLVKEKRYTINGAKEYLKHQSEGFLDRVQTINKLKSMKEFLTSLRDEIAPGDHADKEEEYYMDDMEGVEDYEDGEDIEMSEKEENPSPYKPNINPEANYGF
ncbi:MerR family transcriptional regulator [Aureibacter tunicatorum]|uniref:DNA-binding transcriptional MerR regulator n=1 Tax=Aureibacter tunicatorum TaxID=866807 RepID=A0AAE3XQR6_9BACT|nr:MerR family transcriptional regulator [Aureibacter tunicatorum]MDR6240877.1 DNA-binding transcriptional MerR regulator [Aureibacter tunicatorum]BDD03657.1 hypothetical protein AUTU_11400 [Aureibacter tunicatorum]